jgi:hypothetical protein
MNRRLLSLVLALICFCELQAQAPKGINYQGVARDNEGKPIITKSISVRIGILKNAATGEVEYSEIHKPQTNQFGLFTLIIGQGAPVTGSFAFISWAMGNKWLQIEIDPSGGSSFMLAGSQQLMSVPYAFYAEYSGNGSGSNLTAGQGIAITNGVISNTGDADNSSINELITDATLTADKKLRITDAGGTKEVDLNTLSADNQSLTLTGTSLSISGGNAVNLGSVNTDNQNLTAGASVGTNRTINITNGSSVSFDVADNDNSATNEIQDLTLNTGTNILSLTNDATTVDLSPYKQSLTYNPANNNLAIGGGNNVNITSTLTQVLTTNPSAGNIRIQNVGAPTASTDATSKGYVDTSIANAIATTYAFKTSYAFVNTGGVFNDSPITLTEVFDDFNVVGTNRFTAPSAGTYSFNVSGTSPVGGALLKLKVTSGSTSLYDIKQTVAYPNVTIINYQDSTIYKLNAGDTVELVVTSLLLGQRADGILFGFKL